MGGVGLFFGMIFWLLLMGIATPMYFLPTIIAVLQHRSNVAAVAVINALLGWSFVGWIVALVMALTEDTQPVQVVHVVQQMGYMPIGTQIERIGEPSAPGSELRRVHSPERR
jgi:hypothetical protein